MIKLSLFWLMILGLSSCATTNEIDKALSSFTYKADAVSYWQTSKVTGDTLHGDCEDLAVWLRDIILDEGIDPTEIQMLEGELYGKPHMLIRYKGEFIDSFGRHKFYPEFVITGFWSHTKLDHLMALQI